MPNEMIRIGVIGYGYWGPNANTVDNFEPDTDAFQFSQSMFADAVLSNAHQVGSDVAITHDSLHVVTLHSMQLTNLHASDFQYHLSLVLVD